MPESLLSPSDLDALKARLALDFPWEGLPSLQIITEADRLSVVAINRGHLIQQEHDQLFQMAVGSFLEIIENELPYLGYKVKEERLLLYSPHNEAFKVADLLIEKQPTQTLPTTKKVNLKALLHQRDFNFSFDTVTIEHLFKILEKPLPKDFKNNLLSRLLCSSLTILTLGIPGEKPIDHGRRLQREYRFLQNHGFSPQLLNARILTKPQRKALQRLLLLPNDINEISILLFSKN